MSLNFDDPCTRTKHTLQNTIKGKECTDALQMTER